MSSRHGASAVRPEGDRTSLALSVKATGTDGDALRRYWDVFARLETTPSMAALDYPPHVTLAVYPHIDQDRALAALSAVARDIPAVRLRFASLKYFDEPAFVVWAAPDPS